MPEMDARTSLKSHARANKSSTKLEFCKRLTFTGYLLEEIKAANRKDYDELLAVTDLLIDGPFQRERVEFVRPWVGSSNQRFHFLTNRYADLAPKLATTQNKLEVRLKPDGRIFINGLAPIECIKSLCVSID